MEYFFSDLDPNFKSDKNLSLSLDFILVPDLKKKKIVWGGLSYL